MKIGGKNKFEKIGKKKKKMYLFPTNQTQHD